MRPIHRIAPGDDGEAQRREGQVEGGDNLGGCEGYLPVDPDAIDELKTFGEPTTAGKGVAGRETTDR